MKAMNKTRLALFGAMVAAVCALCALPGMAFAATNVDVHYTDAVGTSKSALVDLEALPVSTMPYGYMYQKGGVNNVIKADKTVTIDQAIKAALEANGDAADFGTIWSSGKALTFTVDGGLPYTKYNQFTYDRLEAKNYFYIGTLPTGYPLGIGINAPAVLALSSGTQKMDVTTPGQTAGSVFADPSFATDSARAPRLLWGWPGTDVPSDQLGGNRYPSNIDSITIS